MAVYDFVPDTLLHQVRNLSDFLGVLVFDKWVSNADGRQAVFFRARVREWLPGAAEAHALTMGFVGLMIDHGFAVCTRANWFMGMWRRWRSSSRGWSA
jgi:hypothetical protein